MDERKEEEYQNMQEEQDDEDDIDDDDRDVDDEPEVPEEAGDDDEEEEAVEGEAEDEDEQSGRYNDNEIHDTEDEGDDDSSKVENDLARQERAAKQRPANDKTNEDNDDDDNDTTTVQQSSWYDRFLMLQEFHHEYGHVDVPKEYDLGLQVWVKGQKFRQHMLTDWQRQQLLSLDGFEFTSPLTPLEQLWYDKLAQLRDFYRRHGHTRVLLPAKNQIRRTVQRASQEMCLDEQEEQLAALAHWVRAQRREYHEGTLAPERIQHLQQLQFDFSYVYDAAWDEQFQRLHTFYRQHGHWKVPCFEGTKGKRYRAAGVINPENQRLYTKLARWIRSQRSRFKRHQLEDHRVAKLDEIGFVWDTTASGNKGTVKTMAQPASLTSNSAKQPRQHYAQAHDTIKWLRQYDKLVDFHREYGHCRVPFAYLKDPNFGNWVSRQRSIYLQGEHFKARLLAQGEKEIRVGLPEERVVMLNLLGFEWQVSKKQARIDGQNISAQEVAMMEQRQNNTQAKELNADGVTTETARGFEEAQLVVAAQRAQTVARQQRKQQSAEADAATQTAAKNPAGNKADPPPDEESWRNMYYMLVQFHQQYGHCRVPYEYVVSPELGKWVAQQRALNSKDMVARQQKFHQLEAGDEDCDSNNSLNRGLSHERVELLDRLGFSWKVSKHQRKVDANRINAAAAAEQQQWEQDEERPATKKRIGRIKGKIATKRPRLCAATQAAAEPQTVVYRPVAPSKQPRRVPVVHGQKNLLQVAVLAMDPASSCSDEEDDRKPRPGGRHGGDRQSANTCSFCGSMDNAHFSICACPLASALGTRVKTKRALRNLADGLLQETVEDVDEDLIVDVEDQDWLDSIPRHTKFLVLHERVAVRIPGSDEDVPVIPQPLHLHHHPLLLQPAPLFPNQQAIGNRSMRMSLLGMGGPGMGFGGGRLNSVYGGRDSVVQHMQQMRAAANLNLGFGGASNAGFSELDRLMNATLGVGAMQQQFGATTGQRSFGLTPQQASLPTPQLAPLTPPATAFGAGGGGADLVVYCPIISCFRARQMGKPIEGCDRKMIRAQVVAEWIQQYGHKSTISVINGLHAF